MSTGSVQSRVSAFESLAGQRSVLQTPLSPRIIPSTPPRVSPSPSPPNLGRKSSLIDFTIDLKDWVFEDGSPPRSNGFNKKTPTQTTFNPDDALIHFSPPKPSNVKAPPLPPRKPLSLSVRTTESSPSLPLRPSPPVPPPVRRGDSLTVEHTYPPLTPTNLSPGRGHTHGSSVSSFHSVSLSDGSPSPSATVFPQHGTGSSESFEELSASTALASPATVAIISHDWEKAMARQKPPQLPARPPAATTPLPAPSARRPAPPPPSDRASIRSVASASSSASTSTSKSSKSASHIAALAARPPPVPPALRRRYDALFSSLLSVHAQPSSALFPPRRRAAGWRGLSVDLIRDPVSPLSPNTPEDDGDMLPGPVVRVVWARSRLPPSLLSAIWNECDTGRTGSLDREAFARGMWRIDEELMHAAAAANGSSGNGRRRGLR
ncbi:hypothetical protein GGX14DRAFT_602645 [Mycena pura]|uniref:EH domain-containing protein n=1 Tax=Mycena pura TaxID=153505 RepID=A0AAD6VQH3_9AGAR|nr:hypothetical protein GGX14DRAFT_602645 [Mycena pura]